MKIAIIYHSETGNTRQMAELVGEGCRKVEGVEARCMRCFWGMDKRKFKVAEE